MDDRPCLVLDTNVVLNWLFFKDAATVGTITPLLTTHQWVSTPWMQREATRVAHSPHLAKYAFAQAFASLEAGFIQNAHFVETIATSPLRCRDPDDQAFLNLAQQTQSHLLLTLDRDLLKLKKAAEKLGLKILAPCNL